MGSLTPAHFQPQSPDLQWIPSQDSRSDEEIIAALQEYKPVTGEKNVWAFWDKGFTRMPLWNQRNVISWVRRLGPSWTVRVLDLVEDSPVNVGRYVDASHFPDAFNNKTMTGPHVGPHSSDLIRLPCLYLYGGIWVDVGMILFRHLDDLCWNDLTDPESEHGMSALSIEFRPGIGTIFNGFIAARKGNGFVKRWHDIFKEVWKGRTDSTDMHAHPLLHHLPGFQPPVEKLEATDLTVTYGQFLDYLSHNLCFERLIHLQDPSDGWDGIEYNEKHILWFDAMQETYYAQKLTGWDGRKQFDLLATKRTDAEQDEKYKEAEAFVEDVMAHSSTMKLSHGLPSGKEYLAAIWDKDATGVADIAPGSFAEFMRYGSVHFKQTRSLKPLVIPPTTDTILKGGVVEAVGAKFSP
ncbi:putative capsule polysaccharide biosynthesis protein [Xylogone sp. PMI_703]|nr:putative capsule polysaccharide biosynthesis protein [Xylogone sp. PMI_703]